MQIANKLVGIININAIECARPFTLGQTKALAILASTAAAALESASLYSKVREAEDNYRSIFENSIEGIFQSTPEGRFLAANPALAGILGYDSPEDLIKRVTDIGRQIYVNPQERARSNEIANENGGLIQHFELEAYRKDQQKIWVSLNRRSINDENGEPLYWEGSVEDITERKRAENALRESEERYRDLVENAHDIIYSHDLDGNYTSMNKAGAAITGYTVQEALKLNLSKTVAPEYLSSAKEMLTRKLAGDRVTAYEMEIIAKDGRRITVEAN